MKGKDELSVEVASKPVSAQDEDRRDEKDKGSYITDAGNTLKQEGCCWLHVPPSCSLESQEGHLSSGTV